MSLLVAEQISAKQPGPLYEQWYNTPYSHVMHNGRWGSYNFLLRLCCKGVLHCSETSEKVTSTQTKKKSTQTKKKKSLHINVGKGGQRVPSFMMNWSKNNGYYWCRTTKSESLEFPWGIPQYPTLWSITERDLSNKVMEKKSVIINAIRLHVIAYQETYRSQTIVA